MAREIVRELGGRRLIERTHTVPLDHGDSAGATLEVFTREVADLDGLDRPLLVYLQGGPGFESPRPSWPDGHPPWLSAALEHFRVLLLDQRGTGRSTPFGPRLAPSADPAGQADYLSHFRADSIVADCELIRAELGVERWSLLGQSFGGFCSLRYLSVAPEALREVLFSGGLPALETPVDDIFRGTLERMRDRSATYYRRYPDDRERVRALVERLDAEPLELPGGDLLDGAMLRSVGIMLGEAAGAETVHRLIELDPDSPAFGHDFEWINPYPRNPLYAVLHESCWADGFATRWSGERVFDEADWAPEDFTGEHIFRWMFERMGGLRPFAQTADILADWNWPELYDTDRLEANDVPAAAIIYGNDVYVERRFSEQTARRVAGTRVWLTNEYEHDGLYTHDGGRIFTRLLDLARGRI